MAKETGNTKSRQTAQSGRSRSENTRKHIQASYLSLMREKNWDRITVIEVCSAAGITRGTFYQYYNDIYDVVEQLENTLLTDLTARYHKCRYEMSPGSSPVFFPERFDTAPPQIFLEWFSFCREHADAMIPLLDRKKGDTRFIRKLRSVIEENVTLLMDNDGLPNDDLRSHFVSVLSEMHFLAAQGWLDPADPDRILDESDIVNLLNTMRVGSVYLAWKEKEDRNSIT